MMSDTGMLCLVLGSLLAGSGLPAENAAVATQEETADQYLIDGRVLDADSGEPIEDFRVLPGTPFRQVRTAHDPTPAVWQPHLIRICKKGRLQWPRSRGYRQMRLRIEADGYLPQQTLWIGKDDASSTRDFRLQRDPGIAGRVLTPAGEPAVGAVLAVALPNRSIRLEGRKIAGSDAPPPKKPSDCWRRPSLVKSDAEGRYRLPTEPTAAAMLCVVHNSGYLDLPFRALAEAPTLRLRGWGRIAGRVNWLDLPAKGESIDLSTTRDAEDYPMIEAYRPGVTTDTEGRFVFEDVPPGRVQLSRRVLLPESGKPGAYAFPIVHVDVPGDGDTDVQIGGLGRIVKGRLQGLENYRGITLRIAPNAPHFGFSGDNELWKGFAALRASSVGPLVFRDQLPVQANGTFRIPDVIPAWYQLFVHAADGQLIGSSRFQVHGYEHPGADQPQDIGSVRLRN